MFPGQFVDVLVYPEIVREPRGRTTVRFVMERIIVLHDQPVKVRETVIPRAES